MKKFLIAVIMFLPLVASAFTGEVDIDEVKYSISTKTQTAIAVGLSNPDYVGELVIHGSIEYEGIICYVGSVGGFAGSTGISSITLEEGITTIERESFRNCTSLDKIIIPASITAVGRYAFEGTAWYNSQNEGVLYLSHVAYCYKGDMPQNSEITIKEGTTVIAKNCFQGFDGLKTIHFPKTLQSIDEYAFWKCTSLISVTLDHVDLHYFSFAGCTSLKEVSLNQVNFIPVSNVDGSKIYDFFGGSNAIEKLYFNCKEVGEWLNKRPSITSLTFGDKVEKINPSAFSGCTGLTSVEFPNSLKHLSGFSGCTGLSEISIPSNVEEIGDNAFSDCTGLTSLNIPSNVKKIGMWAFDRCVGLSSLTLSSGLKTIGGYAFQSCSGLKSIVIPNTVDTIGTVYPAGYEFGYTFANCTGLTSIIIPQGVKYLSEGTFQGCEQLTNVILPEGLVELRAALFYYCKKLETVTIPSSVKIIYGEAFYNCKDLENVYCYSPIVPENAQARGRSVFPFWESDVQYATLYVPAQSIESYKAAKYWQDFGEIVAIPDYEAKKCATPRISYKNSKLEFTCDTEGAQFYSEITDTDIRSSTESVIDLTATYHISVYATAPDHAQSDTMYATLCWIDVEPKTEGIVNTAVASVRAQAVLIQNSGNILTITGAIEGTPISVYDAAGKLVCSAKASKETTTVSTTLSSGQIGIVKIGDKTVKVLMK